MYAPACVTPPKLPCRTLCASIQYGCTQLISDIGFHWPLLLHCVNFPDSDENTLCIAEGENNFNNIDNKN